MRCFVRWSSQSSCLSCLCKVVVFEPTTFYTFLIHLTHTMTVFTSSMYYKSQSFKCSALNPPDSLQFHIAIQKRYIALFQDEQLRAKTYFLQKCRRFDCQWLLSNMFNYQCEGLSQPFYQQNIGKTFCSIRVWTIFKMSIEQYRYFKNFRQNLSTVGRTSIGFNSILGITITVFFDADRIALGQHKAA